MFDLYIDYTTKNDIIKENNERNGEKAWEM